MKLETRLRGTQRRASVLGMAALAAATLLSACSSSSHATSNSTAPTSGSTSGSTPGSSSSVAKAASVVAAAEQRPTSIELGPKITNVIPAGKKIVWINCGSPSCVQQVAILQGASRTLGWSFSSISTTGTPQTIEDAFTSALREKPDAILYAGFPSSLVDPYLTQAKAAGITVIGSGVADNPDLYYVAIDYQDYASQGPVMASFVTAKSNGKGGAVFVTLPDFPILSALGDSFTSSLRSQCPACTSGTLTIPVTAVGSTSGSTIVAYLRAHPNVNYVVVSNDGLVIGLPAALSAAGLSGIHIIGTAPTPVNYQYVIAGTEDATLNADQVYIDYSMMDALVRKFSNSAPPPPFKLPLWILTKSNFNSSMIENGNVPTIPNEIQAFTSNWGK